MSCLLSCALILASCVLLIAPFLCCVRRAKIFGSLCSLKHQSGSHAHYLGFQQSHRCCKRTHCFWWMLPPPVACHQPPLLSSDLKQLIPLLLLVLIFFTLSASEDIVFGRSLFQIYYRRIIYLNDFGVYLDFHRYLTVVPRSFLDTIVHTCQLLCWDMFLIDTLWWCYHIILYCFCCCNCSQYCW